MINKQKTLKLIKEKVDARTNGKIKLKKPFYCTFEEGVFKHSVRKRITSLLKQGNSVMWVDDGYGVRNISILETTDLHKIMWQIISDKEKREIAYEHLITTKQYLTE
jgi:hypothetical protein